MRKSFKPSAISSPVERPVSESINDIPQASATSHAPAHPPIRMDFPKFGESTSLAEVTNFIEQCENFLSLRPFNDQELITGHT